MPRKISADPARADHPPPTPLFRPPPSPSPTIKIFILVSFSFSVSWVYLWPRLLRPGRLVVFLYVSFFVRSFFKFTPVVFIVNFLSLFLHIFLKMRDVFFSFDGTNVIGRGPFENARKNTGGVIPP